MKLWITFSLLFPITCFCASCHRINKHSAFDISQHAEDSLEQQDARQLLLSLKNINSNLKTCKGTGSINVWDNKQYYSSRIAWVAADNKLRIEILGVSGLPAKSIAYDASSIYLFSHFDKRFYKKKLSKNKNIEKIIEIPISFKDIIFILSGRVPVYHHTYLFLKKDISCEEHVLILKNRQHQIIEKIFVNNHTTTAKKIEVYNKYGAMEYRAVFDNLQDIQTYRIPLNIKIENDDARIQIIIDKYWANISVSPSTFVLTP